jgi:hypothetical protein
MRLHKVTRVTDGWHLSGHDISKSFGAKSCCQDILVSFFIQCLLADEVSHGDDTVGYRIFLDPKISVSENFVCTYNVFLFSLIFFVAYRNCCWLPRMHLILIQLLKNSSYNTLISKF